MWSEIDYRFMTEESEGEDDVTSFKKWISTTLFYPLRKLTMKVEVEWADHISVDVPQCKDCSELMKESGVVDKVMSVDWRNVDVFNLKSIVSYCMFVFIRTIL